MTIVLNGGEILRMRKISIALVGCTNVTDRQTDRQTDRRHKDARRHDSERERSRSLKKTTLEIEHIDNVQKSKLFTGSEIQAFRPMTPSLKSLLWFVRQPVFYII